MFVLFVLLLEETQTICNGMSEMIWSRYLWRLGEEELNADIIFRVYSIIMSKEEKMDYERDLKKSYGHDVCFRERDEELL